MTARWPNLFVVGAAKAGTAALWKYLGEHPEIYMSSKKEPSYFEVAARRHSHTVADEASYLELFKGSNGAKLRGEASPSYLPSESAPMAIKRASPDAKIVISLREPVSRAYSQYWYSVRRSGERRSFAEATEAERGRPAPPGRIHGYVRNSLYAKQVERYVRTFPGAVHVLFFEELAAEPRGELRRLFEFLDVDADFADRLDVRAHNEFFLPRNSLSWHLLGPRSARVVSLVDAALKVGRMILPRRLRARLWEAMVDSGPKPPMDSSTRDRLTAFFAPDVDELRRLIGRDVPWPEYAHSGDRDASSGVMSASGHKRE